VADHAAGVVAVGDWGGFGLDGSVSGWGEGARGEHGGEGTEVGSREVVWEGGRGDGIVGLFCEEGFVGGGVRGEVGGWLELEGGSWGEVRFCR